VPRRLRYPTNGTARLPHASIFLHKVHLSTARANRQPICSDRVQTCCTRTPAWKQIVMVMILIFNACGQTCLNCNKPKHQTVQAAHQGPTFGSTPPLSSMSATTVVRKHVGYVLGEWGFFQICYYVCSRPQPSEPD